MTSRSLLAAVGAVAFSLAACQSVHTQDAPAATATPASSPAASVTPAATATPAPTAKPSPAARPARLSYTLIPGVGRTVAMTFDDGPSPKLTPRLLDTLKQRGIRATFFVVGKNAAEFPDILKRAVAEGHEIGNHSWSHPQLTHLGAAGVAGEIEKTNAAIKAAIGHNPVLMRPPYGATTAALDRRFNQEWGLKVILWDVDPLDWKYRNSARVEREILSQIKPGSIVLSHDIHATTVAAMPATLDALIARGFKFVTVSELIAMEGSQAPAIPASTPAPKPVEAPGRPEITPPAPSATPFAVDRYEPASDGSAPR